MEKLKSLVDSYQIAPEAIDIVRKTKIALLVGIAGAGKDTIKRQLLNKNEYHEIVSHTTRSPRTNNGAIEIEGRDYHFISLDEAAEMLLNRQFVEAKLVHGSVVYGTAVYEVDKSRQQNKIALTDIDVQGVAEYQKLTANMVAIFVIPPDFNVWRQRLSRRYPTVDEFASEWERRRDSAVNELEFALGAPYFKFVINNALDNAIELIHQTIQGEAVSADDEARQVATRLLADIRANS